MVNVTSKLVLILALNPFQNVQTDKDLCENGNNQSPIDFETG